VYKVNLFLVVTFVFDDPTSFCLGKGDDLLLLGSSSSDSGMMIRTLFTDLLTTLSWFQLQLVHTNVDMVICQLEAAQKHSQLQSKSLSNNNNMCSLMESNNKDVKLSCDEPKNGPKHHVQSINISMKEKTNTADIKKTITSESKRSSFILRNNKVYCWRLWTRSVPVVDG
jgi:hypothetical protein